MFYLYIRSFEPLIAMFRMLLRGFCVRLNMYKLCFILAVAATGICFVLRIHYPVEKAFSTVEDKSHGQHLTLPDNSVNNGFQMNVTQLLNGKFLIRNNTKQLVLPSLKKSMLESARDLSNDRQITTRNSSVQKNYQKNKTKIEYDESSSKKLNSVPSTAVYPLFQSAEEEEFPTTDGHLPRIPHIIHQMYADEMIPEMYINHVKSFLKHNPTWDYRFWTDESGRKLLQKHHPYLVQVYDNFGSSVKRSDLLRYVVLYEYGGFYSDLDIDNLRSLNKTTIKYACIVPVEPFEHSILLYSMDFLMNNAIMSCRPKHPFFKLLLWNLREANPYGHPVRTTGPGYVTRQFILYNHIGFLDGARNKTDWTSNSPYFYKGEFREDDDNSVYVPNSQYFMDKIDPTYIREDGKFTQLCKSISKLPYLKQRACSEFYRREMVRIKKKYTFTVHHWYHLWMMKKSSVDDIKKINISDVVSNCILYQ